MNRNVLCTSNPYESQLHTEAYEWAKKISEHLLPRTRAYAEIWLDQKKVATTDEEPILGQTYLPRKFKTTVVIPPQNDIDLHANDMNFVQSSLKTASWSASTCWSAAVYRLSTAIRKPTPVRRASLAICRWSTLWRWRKRWSRPSATGVTVPIVKMRKPNTPSNALALRPLRRKWNVGRASSLSRSVRTNSPYRGDRIGWVKGIDNNWHLTLFIENGRILDYPGRPLKTGLLKIAKIHKGEFRITANQNLIIASVPEDQKAKIEKLARDHGLMNAVTPQRENSMACVSFPTCPLAMAEAERFLPSFIDKVEAVMSKHGVGDEHIVTRVTGCPNGCGRAMLAEVGLVGKAPGRYNLHLGGNRSGTRIPRMYRENITESEILDSIDELVGRWAKEREAGEGFGDFTVRAGIIRPVLDPARDFWE